MSTYEYVMDSTAVTERKSKKLMHKIIHESENVQPDDLEECYIVSFQDEYEN